MDLQELRQRIDEIDNNLVNLFQQRMDVTAEIAQYKKEHNVPVYDPEREQQKLRDISGKVKKGFKADINSLFFLIFELSRTLQERITKPVSQSIDADCNVVLIGMPGSGKTSIGKKLAEITGRTFADTDTWITDTAGKPIPAILKEDGEDMFRKLETEALRVFCKQKSLVIATGGGVVTQSVNRSIISQNSIIVFLDRDINQLPVSGRPLSQNNGIAQLAEERLPLYSEWSEFKVQVRGVEETARDIYERIFGGD